MNVLFAAIVALTNLCGVVGVDTHGARVASYVPASGGEIFFTSATGTGGMPLCWPWFAGLGPSASSRRHGIARYRDFTVVSEKVHSPRDSELTLRLVSDAETRREFPHDFSLTVSIRLADRLIVTMTGENTGSDPFPVTEALHPYLAVEDSRRCEVRGVETFECTLFRTGSGRALTFTCAGGGFRIWRPNPESHSSKTVSSLAPGDWKRFICVESGTFANAYLLNPGEKHVLRCAVCEDMPGSVKEL